MRATESTAASTYRRTATRTVFRLRAGWDVDSSFLTAVPATFKTGRSSTSNPSDSRCIKRISAPIESAEGLVYGAQLNYEGAYNELNRTPYATLDAHVAYRSSNGYEFGLYGTNLTNVYALRSRSSAAAFSTARYREIR